MSLDASRGVVAVVWHVSDPHLSATGARGTDGRPWQTLAEQVRAARPDAVLITGDLVADHPDTEDDHTRAHGLINDLDAPVWTLPGNHDVGDQSRRRPGLPADWHGASVTSERCTRWVDRWGPDRWCLLLPGWALIGLNSQVMGSGLPEEEAQRSWLEAHVPELGGRRVAVFTHQALDATALGLPADSWTAIPPPAAEHLRRALAPLEVRLLAHGHIHRHHVTRRGEVLHISTPSISAPIPVRSDMHQPAGEPVVGWVEYRFRPGDLDPEVTTFARPSD